MKLTGFVVKKKDCCEEKYTRNCRKENKKTRKTVSVMLTAIKQPPAALERQPPASSHFSSHKQNWIHVSLMGMEPVSVLLVTALSSFD